MNDPSKRIEIEQSSLMSLKAELLRKQSEVQKNKKQNFVPKLKKISKDVNIEKAVTQDVEVNEDHAKRLKILEAKSKYYDKMMKEKVNSDLVLFKNKLSQTSEQNQDDLIEYKDCFGRTRKIKKDELEKIRFSLQDEEIEDEIDIRNSNDEEKIIEIQKPQEDIGEYHIKQREEWKAQEEINRDKSEVHYQDILFDEARSHGISYYAFSGDNDERKMQQEKLLNIRKQTEKAQNERASLKKQRDEIISNRMKHAKERIRLKLGLPVEESTVKENQSTIEEKEESSNNNSHMVTEEEMRREEERKNYIRPWDEGKVLPSKSSSDAPVDWEPKKEKFLLTQDEWIEKQRGERNNTFAPSYDKKREYNSTGSRLHPRVKDNDSSSSSSSQNKKIRLNDSATEMEQAIVTELRLLRDKFGPK